MIIETNMCFLLIGPLYYSEITEDIEKSEKFFNEIDGGKREISDSNDNDVQSNSEKEQDKVKANIKEINFFQLSLFLCVVDF